MIRRTSLVRSIEAKYDAPIEDTLRCLLAIKGPGEVAKELGVKKAILGYWALMEKIPMRRDPGDVKR